MRYLITIEAPLAAAPVQAALAAKLNPKFAGRLESAALRCEAEGTREAALAASNAASEARRDADAADAAYAAYAAADAARDRILTISADIGLAALIECGSPGCAYLYLTEGT